VILFAIYQNHNMHSTPHELWLQVVNDASQLAETIRRQIIRTKRTTDFNVYTQIARLFCRLSAFIGSHLYEPSRTHNPIASLMQKPPLDDFISGPERYEKWILWKYPNACPTCGNCPCVCAAYRRIMEDRNNSGYDAFWKQHAADFATLKERYRSANGEVNQEVKTLYEGSLDDWVEMFHKIYGSGHIEMSLESIAFHFLEEIGEVSDGLLCLDELFRYRGTRQDHPVDARSLHDRVIQRAGEDPAHRRFSDEYQAASERWHEDKSEFAFSRLVDINVSLMKEELADVFSWMCALLNKIDAAAKYWNPEGASHRLADELHDRYSTGPGDTGCSYCGRAICARDCLVESTIRKSIGKRNQKLNHRLVS
jgi:NTP pyrophosphatase (non-canonical NTP hydrolase)